MIPDFCRCLDLQGVMCCWFLYGIPVGLIVAQKTPSILLLCAIQPDPAHEQDTYSLLERIADDLHYAKVGNDDTMESIAPLSVQREGKTTFRRSELVEELTSEQKQLRHMLKLHFIDMEFHDANQTTSEHIECFALHGYRTLLWTQDARVALEREHSRLVARLVAIEIVDDILQWMLEGWRFGERQSPHEAVGHVPRLKKDRGVIKVGVGQKVREPSIYR